MSRLISFDIDGTLEAGDPPGRVTFEMVRRARKLGYIIGSASDRPVAAQRAIWERAGIEIDFAVHKHKLDEVKAQFEAESYQHIGDTNMDEYYALMHGFDYLDVARDQAEEWMFLEVVEEVAEAEAAAEEASNEGAAAG
jgi:hypothetical protein